jgi:hypothetical protein
MASLARDESVGGRNNIMETANTNRAECQTPQQAEEARDPRRATVTNQAATIINDIGAT